MRSVVLIGFIMFLVVLAGGYSITWYAQASALKKNVEETIARINGNQKYITYDAIETSGFPSNLYVAIVKPHFKGRMNQLLQSLAPMPNWDEDDALDGQIVLGINALSNAYSLSFEGNVQQTSKIGDVVITTLHQQSGSFSCVLQMHHPMGIIGTLWDFSTLTADDSATFFKDFRMADCNQAGNATTDAATHEKLTASGPFRFYVTQDETSGARRIYVKLEDMEITPHGDAMMAGYILALSPDYSYPINYSVYGKQNLSLDFIYNGPDAMNGEATLSTFEVSNALYGIKASGSAKLAQRFPQAVNITLVCSHCAALVDDMAAHGDLQKTAGYSANPPPPENIKAFLNAIAVADDNDKTAQRFVLTSDLNSGFSVNGKNMGDVMQLVNQYLKPPAKQPMQSAPTGIK